MTKVQAHDQQLGFNIHALSFAGTLALCLAIDLLAAGPFWTHWVILGLLARWVFGSARARARARGRG